MNKYLIELLEKVIDKDFMENVDKKEIYKRVKLITDKYYPEEKWTESQIEFFTENTIFKIMWRETSEILAQNGYPKIER